MPLKPIPLEGFKKIGLGVKRPEDVVVGRDGRVWAADLLSACAEIRADGTLHRVGTAGGAPNGINMDAQGRIIIANYGVLSDEPGPVQRLDPETGELTTLCAEIDGRVLIASNYPIVAQDGTIWCTHSTWASPSDEALRDFRDDGFIMRLAPDGSVSRAAAGLKFANGCALDADETHLFVCQTTGANVLRYEIRGDGALGPPEQYGPTLGKVGAARGDAPPTPEERATWGYTDGCGFDAEGNLWVTLTAANKVVAITPGGDLVTVVHDLHGDLLTFPTNVSWGGTDMCDLYIGTIRADYVLQARSPVPGLKMIHQR